ncbi:MAG: EAL domain-containing protein [Oscillospiraceae bacterium]|nr:EAL domain-containing protein [Oscillospiraceae bacterium]
MPDRKKLLIVEDNEINRALLVGVLSSEYDIYEAGNGEEALKLLEEHSEEISLILLDIIMPVMDGYTFLSIVKKNPRLYSIPVIVTTQNDAEADEVTALSHGATDFISKPYKPKVILHRVASIIRLRETAAMVNLFKYDRLTGLFSKEYFFTKGRELLQQNPTKEYVLVCSDIENFKLTNDAFGTQECDRFLKGVADICRGLLDKHGIMGRFYADQFVCLAELGHFDYQVFDQIVEEVNSFSQIKNISMKFGVYIIDDRSVSIEQMCDRALLAADGIKGHYGQNYAVYDDVLRGRLIREQAITDSMESALASGQFDIHLQPKYRVADGALSGAEALVRWNHPQWGMQYPNDFISLFEKNGFITTLDAFVWERACQIMHKWDEEGRKPLSISVNVSRADAYKARLPELLKEIVDRHGLHPERLHLEITESAYTENPAQIIETVSRLRELGFIIEMDDFGSGYSSLNMLNELPIDILKLDMRFIQSDEHKLSKEGILNFIMGLASWMNLGVVAEGVENERQVERLRELGCDYVQGYYYARPMPLEDFERIILNDNKAKAAEPQVNLT